MGDTAGASISYTAFSDDTTKENFTCKQLRGTFQGTSAAQVLRSIVNSLL